jgi:hypothetical protein
MTLEELADPRLGHRTDHAVDLLAVAQQDERRNALDPEARSDLRGAINVELDHLQLAGVLARLGLHGWGHHPARSAPRRPEVDQHRYGCRRLGLEAGRVSVDDPGQEVVAVAASRDARRGRRDAVLLAAIRAGDRRHAA